MVFQAVVFKLNEERYGVDINYVNGIEREQTVIRVPNTSSTIKGIINLRGEVIPVINLKAKFGAPYEDKDKTELIIVNLKKGRLALEVDGVDEIHNIDAENIVDMPLIAKGEGVEYFDRIAKVNGKLIIMINPQKLLSETEADNVELLAENSAE
ncbi:MAG: chemotaxis protein CheW [Butyrivibrio sp.]